LLWALLLSFTLQMMIIYTPFFNDIFKTQPLTLYELGIIILVSTILFWAVEIEKWIKRKRICNSQVR
jgi:Ca2+-transporting ATPase